MEIRSLEADRKRIENDTAQEELHNKRQDRTLRKSYADRIFTYLLCYSVFCGLIVLAQGRPESKFHLDQNIVIALVGGTAVAVIGLVGWIVKGLFKPPKE